MDAGFEEAFKQARGGVVVGQPFAKRRGRQPDAAIRVVCARGHFVPKAFDARGCRPSILRKAHRQIGVGHRIEGRGLSHAAPRIDVRTPHAARAEFFPNVHVFRIIDPARRRGRAHRQDQCARSRVRLRRSKCRPHLQSNARCRLTWAFVPTVRRCARIPGTSRIRIQNEIHVGRDLRVKLLARHRTPLGGRANRALAPGIRIVDPCWPVA